MRLHLKSLYLFLSFLVSVSSYYFSQARSSDECVLSGVSLAPDIRSTCRNRGSQAGGWRAGRRRRLVADCQKINERASDDVRAGGGVVCRGVEIEAVSLLYKRKAATEGKSHYPTSGRRREAKKEREREAERSSVFSAMRYAHIQLAARKQKDRRGGTAFATSPRGERE